MKKQQKPNWLSGAVTIMVLGTAFVLMSQSEKRENGPIEAENDLRARDRYTLCLLNGKKTWTQVPSSYVFQRPYLVSRSHMELVLRAKVPETEGVRYPLLLVRSILHIHAFQLRSIEALCRIRMPYWITIRFFRPLQPDRMSFGIGNSILRVSSLDLRWSYIFSFLLSRTTNASWQPRPSLGIVSKSLELEMEHVFPANDHTHVRQKSFVINTCTRYNQADHLSTRGLQSIHTVACRRNHFETLMICPREKGSLKARKTMV